MKNSKYILLFLVLFLFLPLSTYATTKGSVNDTGGLNIRNKPSTSGSILGLVTYGNSLTLVNNTITPDTSGGCSDGWYQVYYGSGTGYACSTYLNIYTTSDKSYTARVTCSGYISVWDRTIKDWNFKNSKLLDKLITGTSLTILETLPSGGGCDEEWYRVQYQNGKTGYACSNDADKIEELTLNSSDYTESEKTYANTLKTRGFTDDYIIYLMKMKRDHPLWDFFPYKTNIKFNDAIHGEEWKNKIEGVTTTYLKYYAASLDGTEGGDWYYTNNDTNAYFMDARNFLTERFIFMFEELSYNTKTHTTELLTTFLNNTWLNTDAIKSYFFKAASLHNVSPIHLASRIYKEGGTNSGYGPVTGLYDIYGNNVGAGNGYYNFYNIGAYSSWVQGMCFAAGHSTDKNGNCVIKNSTTYTRPWKSIESAIIGGAEFISEDYIKPGQDTMYFQKFNVKVMNYYTNQYMTNVMAPTQESEITYKKLKNANVLDKSYNFIIPIYNEMPERTSLPSAASSDNSLKSILINNKAIDNFDPDVLEYSYYVQNNVNKVNIKATPNDSNATADTNGDISLTGNETKINIIVKAENTNTRTYKITIKKVSGVKTVEDIIGTLSTKVHGNSMTSISPKTDSSSLINSIKKADPTSNVVYKNSSNTIVTGSTRIKTNDSITITSSSNETVSYKLIVNGDVSGDGEVTILDLLKVQKHILASSKLTDSYLTAGDTNSDNKVDILDLLRVQKYILGSINL